MPFDPKDSLEARRASCWALHGVSLLSIVMNPQAAAAGVGAQGLVLGAEAQTGEGLSTGLYGGSGGSGGHLGVKISREDLLLLQQEQQQQREGEACYQPAVAAPFAPPPSIAAGGGGTAATAAAGLLEVAAAAPAAAPAGPPPVVAIAGGWNRDDDSSDENDAGSGGVLGIRIAAAAVVGTASQARGPIAVGAGSVPAPVAAVAAGGGSKRGLVGHYQQQ